MHKFSFKIRHKNCAETSLSIKFPKHHINVFDIQSRNPKDKQYVYYIKGNGRKFDEILSCIKKSKSYKFSKEIERKKDTIVIVVMLHQESYIQNIIQKYNGFLIDLHTVEGGFEYWHVGVVDKSSIENMRKELKKIGELKTLYIGEADFESRVLSRQQKKIFTLANEMGYYETPRKATIEKIAKALKLNHSTVGEHILKAENKVVKSFFGKI